MSGWSYSALYCILLCPISKQQGIRIQYANMLALRPRSCIERVLQYHPQGCTVVSPCQSVPLTSEKDVVPPASAPKILSPIRTWDSALSPPDSRATVSEPEKQEEGFAEDMNGNTEAGTGVPVTKVPSLSMASLQSPTL